MQEMLSNNKKQWLLGGMRPASDKEVVLVSFDKKREQKQQSGYSGVSANELEKQTRLESSDETNNTADVSDSDSDFGSEHSFSISRCPYPSSHNGIPAKNHQEQTSEPSIELERLSVRLFTSYPSSLELKEEDSLADHIQVAPREEYVESAKKKSSSTRKWYLLAMSLLAAFFSYRFIVQNSYDVTSTRDTIYVPGAGFSGFWFTLGRLQSIDQPDTKDYYCFSAGCLGVVSSLRNFTVDETLDIALNIQERWKSGQIARHHVVGEFVDSLLNTTSSTKSSLLSVEESSVLERMHVITSVKDKWFGMKTHIRSPRTSDELREMLLQTTWM